MASGTELTPTSYMSHHLTNLTSSIGEGEFWTLHVDTLVMAALTGIVSLGWI